MNRKLLAIVITAVTVTAMILSVPSGAFAVDTSIALAENANEMQEGTPTDVTFSGPKITMFENIATGTRIKWTEYENAVNYRLFYWDGSSWKPIKTVAETSCTHTNLTSGKTYLYTVRALDNNGEYIGEYDSEGKENLFLSVPVISSIKNDYAGVWMKWDNIDKAEKYRIYRKDSSSNWEPIGETYKASYTDTKAVSGTKYRYTVRCISADSQICTSYYNYGVAVTYVASPKITGFSNTATGTKITWSKSVGAEKYVLYVKKSQGWAKLSETADLSYTHNKLTPTTTYTYTVRGFDKKGNAVSGFNKEGWSNLFLTAPDISSVKNTVGGVQIQWGKLKGAESYRLFKKTDGSSWSTVTDTAAGSYIDKNVSSGKSYSYKLRCVSSDGKKNMSVNGSAQSITYVEIPVVKSISNTASGIKITWSKVAGATKYMVYVKDGTSWKKLGDTASTSYTHKSLKSGVTYTYTVRCMDASGKLVSANDKNGWSKTFIAPPKITSASNVLGGIQLKWNKSSGAKKYRVFRKTDNSEYIKLSDLTDVKYIDKNVISGKSYTYTVRCITEDGTKYTSAADESKTQKYVKAPTITKFENKADGIKLTWEKSTGASKYRVYVYTSDGWKWLADTASLSYTHSKLKNGVSYQYTVRCLNNSGKLISSGEKGKSNLFLAPPKLSSITASENGNLIKWKAVSGASGYVLFRRTFNGSWTKISKRINDTSYVDKTIEAGKLYSYTLRCLDATGNYNTYYLNNTKYYKDGKAADGKVSVDGNVYYFVDGQVRRGYVTVNGKTYYYNAKGELEKNGIVGTKAEGYCYADKTGAIDYTFTGIAKNANGYWYIRKGKLDFTCRNGITYNGADWLVLNGKATKVRTEADKTFFRALKLVNKVTDSSMSKEKKLKTCFDYVKGAYTELNPRIPHYTGMDWPIIYANDMFVNGAGNCMSYGAAFAFMAKAIGYENVYCCNSGGHGWAEIDGLIYDPEWSRHFFVHTYYALSYDTPVDNNYKGAISPGYPWMHIKI